MYFRQIHDVASNALTYLLADEASGAAVVIDPLRSQATLILAMLTERSLRLIHVLRTHVHKPSRAECGDLCPNTGASLILGQHSPDDIEGLRVRDGDEIRFGTESVRVIETPGHAPGSVCYLVQDRLFCGDTLLISCCDCLSADADPGQLYDSVKQKLFILPDETLVFPGHDAQGRTVSTIGEERRRNVCFAARNRQSFITTMRRAAAAAKAAHPSALISHGTGSW